MTQSHSHHYHNYTSTVTSLVHIYNSDYIVTTSTRSKYYSGNQKHVK